VTPAALHQQRCFHHAAREAVARCPSCTRFFCRECIVEHAGRVLCAACLADQAATVRGGARWAGLWWGLSAVTGFLFSWMAFTYLGGLLSRVPAEFLGGWTK
jgi:hypothetical protein